MALKNSKILPIVCILLFQCCHYRERPRLLNDLLPSDCHIYYIDLKARAILLLSDSQEVVLKKGLDLGQEVELTPQISGAIGIYSSDSVLVNAEISLETRRIFIVDNVNKRLHRTKISEEIYKMFLAIHAPNQNADEILISAPDSLQQAILQNIAYKARGIVFHHKQSQRGEQKTTYKLVLPHNSIQKDGVLEQYSRLGIIRVKE